MEKSQNAGAGKNDEAYGSFSDSYALAAMPNILQDLHFSSVHSNPNPNPNSQDSQ